MSFTEAAISEPLAIGVYAVKQSIPMEGAKVGILGFGPIGMSVLLPAKAYGADTFYVTDKIDGRLELAKEVGASWTGNPDKIDVAESINREEKMQLDVVFECCGQQDAVDNALEILKPGGKLMLIGIPEEDKICFKMDLMRRKEITVVNVRRQIHCVQEALDLIADGRVDVSKMATHNYSFKDTKTAFDLVEGYQDGVMKAMINF
jgi:L-iditol 2-dehydrogenase